MLYRLPITTKSIQVQGESSITNCSTIEDIKSTIHTHIFKTMRRNSLLVYHIIFRIGQPKKSETGESVQFFYSQL